MTPFVKDIDIRFGDTKKVFFRVRGRVWNGDAWVAGDYRDLTGCTFLSQVRADTEAAEVLLTFVSTMGDQEDLVDGIGSVLLSASGAVTGGLARTLTKGVWDVQITFPDGEVSTYIEGAVTFKKDVSRV